MRTYLYRFFLLLILACQVSAAMSQKHSEYYYQRVSLFDRLPADSTDIIFLGNSITNGCEWCELFADSRVRNRGINGDTSRGVLDRLESTLKGHPAKVFLMIGVNDIANGASPDSVINVMDRILDRAASLSPSTRLYVQSILPINDTYNIFWGHMDKSEQIKEYNAKLEQLCRQRGVPFIDLYSRFCNPGTDKMNLTYTNDGLHLMAEGYMLWRDIIMPYIKD
ncbi:MAG: sialate O-acetylesterase [Bacteroides sp.]|nr:sialate O-acetylesterase [Bacteroides sp.]